MCLFTLLSQCAFKLLIRQLEAEWSRKETQKLIISPSMLSVWPCILMLQTKKNLSVWLHLIHKCCNGEKKINRWFLPHTQLKYYTHFKVCLHHEWNIYWQLSTEIRNQSTSIEVVKNEKDPFEAVQILILLRNHTEAVLQECQDHKLVLQGEVPSHLNTWDGTHRKWMCQRQVRLVLSSVGFKEWRTNSPHNRAPQLPNNLLLHVPRWKI